MLLSNKRSKSSPMLDFCGINFGKIFNFGNIVNSNEPDVLK